MIAMEKMIVLATARYPIGRSWEKLISDWTRVKIPTIIANRIIVGIVKRPSR